ncbi:hypothetical protein KJ693_11630, partial [bacterium]|nr:hypothetical protein [bacterium]MBU1615941.1 hypothetical protein [bacterium]
MRKNRAFRIIFKIGLWAMVLLAALLLVKFYQEKQHPSIKEIKTISVRYKMMNVGLISTGVIEPMEHVGVRAEIGGILRDMKWQRGEIIKKGVLWGIIDSPEVISNLQNIEGIKVKVQQMDIDCQNALKKYTRSKELYSKGVVSREMMEMAEVEYNKIHLSEQLLKQQLKVEEERERRLEEQIKIASP